MFHPLNHKSIFTCHPVTDTKQTIAEVVVFNYRDVIMGAMASQITGVSNHQRLDCLLNRMFSCRSKETSKLRVTGLCEGNPPVDASTTEMFPFDDVIMHCCFLSWLDVGRNYPDIASKITSLAETGEILVWREETLKNIDN